MPHPIPPRRALLALALLLAATPVAIRAQGPPPGCTTPMHRQFDFWLGEWTVTDAAGKTLGTNVIRSVLDGCVLHENWTAAGMSGNSYNIYFAAEKRWHQTWVDTQGTLLELNGGLREGKMVLEGEGPGSPTGRVKHRITWSKLDRGRLRQVWESSSDGGATWSTAFDGTYVPRGT